MGTLAINKTGTSHNVVDINFNAAGGKIVANEDMQYLGHIQQILINTKAFATGILREDSLADTYS